LQTPESTTEVIFLIVIKRNKHITASEITAVEWVDFSKTYNTPATQVYDMIVNQASGQNASAGTSS
jgi:hypothetical protein